MTLVDTGGIGLSALYIILTFKFRREGKRWTAYCEELGTAIFGRSLPDAEKKLEEAVALHLDTLEDVGERERFLAEQNVVVHRTRPTSDISVCTPVNLDQFVRPYIQTIRELTPA